MAKMWLQTSDGKLIHLPIQGVDDFNTPDDPIKIPTSMIVNQDRCYAEPITIIHPILGSVTIDMKLADGRDSITGSCVQCGMCCGHPVSECTLTGPQGECGYIYHADLNWHVCRYLDIKNWRKFGQADNTTCTLYASILDNFKGCAFPPKIIYSWMTGCGYTYGT